MLVSSKEKQCYDQNRTREGEGSVPGTAVNSQRRTQSKDAPEGTSKSNRKGVLEQERWEDE